MAFGKSVTASIEQVDISLVAILMNKIKNYCNAFRKVAAALQLASEIRHDHNFTLSFFFGRMQTSIFGLKLKSEFQTNVRFSFPISVSYGFETTFMLRAL